MPATNWRRYTLLLDLFQVVRDCNWWFWMSVPPRSVFVLLNKQYLLYANHPPREWFDVWLNGTLYSCFPFPHNCLLYLLCWRCQALCWPLVVRMVQCSEPWTASQFMKLTGKLIEHCNPFMSKFLFFLFLSFFVPIGNKLLGWYVNILHTNSICDRKFNPQSIWY